MPEGRPLSVVEMLPEPPLTVSELAQRWKCSDFHIRNLIRDKKLFAFRAGSLLRIPVKAVKDFEAGECGSSSGIVEAGTPPGPEREEPAAPHSAPRIVVLPSGH